MIFKDSAVKNWFGARVAQRRSAVVSRAARCLGLASGPALAFGVAVALGSLACATVTQEDPPSSLPPGGGQGAAGGSAPTGSGGSGLATGGTTPNNMGGSTNASNGGSGPTPSNGGSGAGQGGSAVAQGGGSGQADAGRQFPPGMLLLDDDFEMFNPADWAASTGSQWAITTDPGATGNVYGQTETSSSAPRIASSGDQAWTDVILQADFKIISFNGGGSSYMAGLCVRITDAENFYMIGVRSNDGNPFQLRKLSTDEDTILTQSDTSGATGVWYTLRVEAIGSTLSAYLGDELLFTENDATHPTGAIGLCTLRASAVFDNVFVTSPP